MSRNLVGYEDENDDDEIQAELASEGESKTGHQLNPMFLALCEMKSRGESLDLMDASAKSDLWKPGMLNTTVKRLDLDVNATHLDESVFSAERWVLGKKLLEAQEKEVEEERCQDTAPAFEPASSWS